MKLFIAWLGFLGDWLLFVFPLFQGILDVTEGSEMLTKGNATGKKRSARFASLMWLLPPIKIMLERKRFRQISRAALNHNVDFDKVYRKLNLATAWVYVSLAGVLNGVVATEDLLEQYGYGDNWWLLLGASFLIIFSGIQVIRYYASPDRKQRFFDELN